MTVNPLCLTARAPRGYRVALGAPRGLAWCIEAGAEEGLDWVGYLGVAFGVAMVVPRDALAAPHAGGGADGAEEFS